MKTVTIHQAKTHLSRLIREVLGGEEVVIARGRNSLVKIVPLKMENRERHFGCARGIVSFIADDFDAPLDDFNEYSS